MSADDDKDKNSAVPDVELALLRFQYENASRLGLSSSSVQEQIMAKINEHSMGPLYEEYCNKHAWMMDSGALEAMEAKNKARVEELEKRLADAELSEGESEVREALLATALHFASIGDQARAETAFRKTAEKTVGLGQRLDIVFALIRIGFVHDDKDLIVRNIEKGRSMLEEGASDWDRKNKLKVYEAVYNLTVRQFDKAAQLLLDTLSTFTSYELFSYQGFIFYAVISSMISLDRPALKAKIIDAPEVLSVINDVPHLSSFLNSFYNTEYKQFFVDLAAISDRVKLDWILGTHIRYWCREMRIRAYAQLLESYRSVQLSSMAEEFGVSEEFIDQELSRFISTGRLHCKIDKVAGIVETNRPDTRNAQYQSTIKHGDLLLNRVQKLSRVINL
eukprot:TRINITY_DN3058_c0_g1_i1.p1 TRINITY_DN3058_c0_g1~~TRINITY_DN3058_c0_g1_i1.p1  ORF type:complete len:420 (+),score=167.41 TRINITY_DN3058_c0_g1_i1:85-1260(+)